MPSSPEKPMKSEPLVSDFSMPSKIHANDKSASLISAYGLIEPYKDGASQNYFDNDLMSSSNKEIDFKISMITGTGL